MLRLGVFEDEDRITQRVAGAGPERADVDGDVRVVGKRNDEGSG
jgi:hypothetical protein